MGDPTQDVDLGSIFDVGRGHASSPQQVSHDKMLLKHASLLIDVSRFRRSESGARTCCGLSH